jgi:excisionase family DNA binding protein
MHTQTIDPDHYDRLINEIEASDYLGLSERTLQKWRVVGGGPRFVKISGRMIRYRRRDLNAWSEARLRANTSQDAA